MKNILFVLPILTLILLNSCSDDFLYKSAIIVETSSDTIYISESLKTYSKQISAGISKEADYVVSQYPKFMSLTSMKGHFKSGFTTLEFTSPPNIEIYQTNGPTSGQLILKIEGYGLVAYPVKIIGSNGQTQPIVDYGNISFLGEILNIGESETKTYSFTNVGSEPVSWSIKNIPNWLTIDKTSSTLLSGETETLTFDVDKRGKSIGNYSSYIEFELTNNVQNSFMLYVSMDVTTITPNGNTQKLEGFVIAANYIKNTNKLLILTQSPNRLTIFDTNNETQIAIDLPKKPFCMTISEDQSMAIIGYTVAVVSSIDLKENKLIREYEIPFIPFDVELGNNGWCFITSQEYNYGLNLLSLNLATESIILNKSVFSIPEKTTVYKVPDKKILIGLPTNMSPSQFRIGDFMSDTISGDFIENHSFDTSGAIWFIKNGSYSISRGKDIFKMNIKSTTEGTITKYGTFEGGFSAIHWADECEAKNKVALTVSYGYQSPVGDSWVSIWDLDSYSEIKKIFPATIVGSSLYVYYSFFNQEGNKLFMLIRNDMDPYSTKGDWFLETKKLE